MIQERPLETYYITKYALTQGVFPVQAYKVRKEKHHPNCKHEESENVISVAGDVPDYYHKPDWHETMEVSTLVYLCLRFRPQSHKYRGVSWKGQR